MNLDTIPKQSFGFVVEEVEGENLLYRLGAHKAMYLNGTASLIWKLCDGKRAVKDIIELLAQSYPDAEAAIQSDVMEALDLLFQEGAILITGQRA
jgi:hypothetical protein